MIYLDSAATSLLKPESVKRAVLKAMGEAASPGRGSHIYSRAAADLVYECRENISKLFNVPEQEKVVFCFNATHALNIAINSAVKRGSRVLVSPYEHNSVMRPLRALEADIREINASLFRARDFLAETEKLINWADAVVCTHVSNVFGYILPVYELGELCRRWNKPFIVDASQSAGSMKVDFQAMGADFVAFPGHKGLMGPQGTGVLICKNEAKPLLYGGSGTDSLLPLMPDYLPDRLEAGTPNTAGIAGLNEGVKYVLRSGADSIGRYERRLLDIFAAPLLEHEELDVYYSSDHGCQSGLVSIVPKSMSCEAMEDRLGGFGIAVRTGLHCAPSAHRSAGTLGSGSLRISFSPYISAAQARTASQAIEKILKNP